MSDGLSGLLTVAALLGLLAAAYVPLGDYMAAVPTTGRPTTSGSTSPSCGASWRTNPASRDTSRPSPA